MAGDWIKMRSDLHTDPAVIGIACLLEIDEDTVVGKLLRVWAWVDAQGVIDRDKSHGGSVTVSVTASWVDRCAQRPGFAAAMVAAGWLEDIGSAVRFPRFDRHNGQTAKERALAAKRQAKKRKKKKEEERDESHGERGTGSSLLSSPDSQSSKGEDPAEVGGVGEGAQPAEPASKTVWASETFGRFWAVYPSRIGQDVALRAWRDLNPDPELVDMIVQAVKDQLTWEKWQKGFIMDPARWLRERHWTDERPPIQLNGKVDAGSIDRHFPKEK
jgi:hypothetical protein